MKRALLIIAACLLTAGMMTAEVKPMSEDTVIVLKEKRMEVKENGDRIKVRIYELDEDGHAVDDDMVFEGHYRDGRVHERRKYMKSINISVPTWDRDFSAHWAGFGMGFNSFEGDDIPLRKGKSLEYNLNFIEMSLPFSHYNWAVVTGAGLRWNRYRIDTNAHFQEVDGVTGLVAAPEGIFYKKSKLNTTSLTIPVLLEWQMPKKRKRARVFLSGGVVGVIKTTSSSKVVYDDERGKTRKQKMDGGMNLRPVTMDFLLQAGIGCMGVYFKYSPIEMFDSNKGPALNPISFGLHLHL